MTVFRFPQVVAQPHPVRFRELGSWDQLVALAESLEPQFRQMFLDAITALKGTATGTALESALAAGDTEKVLDLLAFDAFEASYSEAMGEAIAAAIEEEVPIVGQVVGSFDMLNPEAVKAAQEAAGQMVTGITETTRQAIRDYVTQSIEQGTGPRALATQVRSVIGLTPAQAKAVLRYESGLVTNGMTPGKAAKLARDYSGRLLDQRAMTIARSETLRALNDGQQRLWDQYVERGILPKTARKVWMTAHDERTCTTICVPLDGEKVGVQESFSVGVDYPPAHVMCRCSVSISP